MSIIRKSVSTNLGSIHLTIQGNGPAMIFWPGLMMDSSMWHHQADYFKENYQVIRIDGPGHGNSERLIRRFTMEECALCLNQIMNQLNINRAIIVGNSWGSIVAGVFSALYPQRSAAIVLMNSTASVATIKQKVELSFMGFLSKIISRIPTILIKQSVSSLIGKSTHKSKNSVKKQLEKILSGLNLDSVKWAFVSLTRRRDIHELLSQVKSPTLVIAGEEDQIFTLDETRNMANAIPNSMFEVLAGVGHSAPLENPQLVNERVAHFLEFKVNPS